MKTKYHNGLFDLFEELRKAGNTDSRIAKLMNVSGMPGRNGRGWTEDQVKSITSDQAPQAPFGYQWSDGELIKHLDEYPARELMVQLREAGLTYAQIADEINDAIEHSQSKR